jgi:hypothetical protein
LSSGISAAPDSARLPSGSLRSFEARRIMKAYISEIKAEGDVIQALERGVSICDVWWQECYSMASKTQ